jgi:hypothetical protein
MARQTTAHSFFCVTVVSVVVVSFAACNGSSLPTSAPVPNGASGSYNSHNSARSRSQSGVFVNPWQVGAQVSSSVLGAGMGVWFNIAQPGLAASLVKAGVTRTRWPGGEIADRYHWRKNEAGAGICGTAQKPNRNSTFDKFMAGVASQARLDVAVTVNYGSNPQCTGGADPTEAAAWVAYANRTKAYNLTWWTVGNEQYTLDALDLHSQPHNPSQYAQVVNQSYYHQMKAASLVPINVCVDAAPWINKPYEQWDATVFTKAQFDCVELHYYPQHGYSVNDAFLIDNAAPGLTQDIQTVRGELAAAGHAGTPIYIGEIGSDTEPGGKQEMSITQALYAGQAIGEMLNDGIARATWHIGYGACDPRSKGGNFSKTLYGWQDYGGPMIFSGSDIAERCNGYNVPLGTLFPTAVAFELASHFVRNGEHMLGVSASGMPDIRAYATTFAGGYALMLFNLNKTSTEYVPVAIVGKSSGSGGLIMTYDKKMYDASKQHEWNGPATSKLGKWRNGFTLTLPAWSMIVVQTM